MFVMSFFSAAMVKYSSIIHFCGFSKRLQIFNCFSILFGIAVNVALAIAVNEIRSVRFRKVTQSIMLFPHFISWVVVGMVFNVLLSEGSGVVNRLLVQLGMDPVKWYTNPWYWWPILVFANVWKSMGYGSLVYFAALTGFDQNLYEAAEIDGASRWQKIAKITLPLLKPTIIIMFLLQVGGILGGAVDPIMGMTQLNPSLLETTDNYVYGLDLLERFFSVFVFNYGQCAFPGSENPVQHDGQYYLSPFRKRGDFRNGGY